MQLSLVLSLISLASASGYVPYSTLLFINWLTYNPVLLHFLAIVPLDVVGSLGPCMVVTV